MKPYILLDYGFEHLREVWEEKGCLVLTMGQIKAWFTGGGVDISTVTKTATWKTPLKTIKAKVSAS